MSDDEKLLDRAHESDAELRAHAERIGTEFYEGFGAVERIDRPAVSIFGSARVREGAPAYDRAREVARRFGEAGWAVVTGGGPGVMDGRNEEAKRLWRRAADLGPVTRIPWPAYLAEGTSVLRSVVREGFALLSGVPTIEGTVTEVAETFGYVRETNYGRIFDVRIEENAQNLAYTGLAISPHTDNPYRDPVPTLQLLHCLTNTAVGGDSGLLDGFAAAATLRESHPASFEVLTKTRVRYRFDSNDTHLVAVAPMIRLDEAGFIREIRFNNRSMEVMPLGPDEARVFYAAYRTFAELLLDPAAQLTFRMTPGDCLIFDNTRVLHARTAFDAVGGRHLQGTYADLDGLLSTLASLEVTR